VPSISARLRSIITSGIPIDLHTRMTYLMAVAAFGTAAVYFLWLRDMRIFRRTGFPGYRKAAYRGVLYAALALLGFCIALWADEVIGIGVAVLALFLQGRDGKERIWTDETTTERLLGSVRRMKDKPPGRDQ
jgi:hypothetical protein